MRDFYFKSALFAALTGLLGCGDFNSRLDGEILDESGGIVRSEQAELTVPAGALTTPILAQIVALESIALPEFAAAVMQPHRLDPVDTVLEEVAELRLTYDPVALRDIDPANLRMVRVEAEGVMRLGGSVIDVDANVVTATVDRLGIYGVAPLCRVDADCQADETCTRGACVAEGECGPGENCACDDLTECPESERCVEGVCSAEPPDLDGDGVPDNDDNCPAVANADQTDTDTDGTGDACQGEICDDGLDNDGDGMIDEDCDPGPEPEVCGDGIDNDTDGVVDEDCDMACGGDGDCAPGQVCVDGMCVE